MDLQIGGRIALVMGAGGGLGSAICAALAREGVRVAGGDRNSHGLRRTADLLTAMGEPFLPLTVDLTDPTNVANAVRTIESTLGPVDVLVNNTGGPPPSTASGVPADTWRAQFDSMVTPIFHLTDLVLPGMRERGWGRVITSASSGVVAPIPNLAISNTLRSALVGWSKTLASEIGRDGVTSNVVIPGRIATQRVQHLDRDRARREGRSVKEIEAASVATIPVGRYGAPEEYADVVAFLASRRAAYINGSIIRVDGGLIPSV